MDYDGRMEYERLDEEVGQFLRGSARGDVTKFQFSKIRDRHVFLLAEKRRELDFS